MQGVGTQDYDVRYDETVKKEVINKLTKMVNDPTFGEQYSVHDGTLSYHFCYWVNSNISKKNVFILFLYKDMDNVHDIFVPGITPLLCNDKGISAFHFNDWEATHICSKLKEWAKIHEAKKNRQIIANKQARESVIRNSALERLAKIQ